MSKGAESHAEEVRFNVMENVEPVELSEKGRSSIERRLIRMSWKKTDGDEGRQLWSSRNEPKRG